MMLFSYTLCLVFLLFWTSTWLYKVIWNNRLCATMLLFWYNILYHHMYFEYWFYHMIYWFYFFEDLLILIYQLLLFFFCFHYIHSSPCPKSKANKEKIEPKHIWTSFTCRLGFTGHYKLELMCTSPYMCMLLVP